MDYIDSIANELDQAAVSDIMKYSIPTLDDYNDTINVAIEIGKKLNANLDVLKLGARFIEIKLGQAIAEKKKSEYINMSLGFAMEFLTGYPLSEDFKKKVLACIKEQNEKNFSCIEAEIGSNSVCYNYLMPKKILRMFYNLKQRGYNFDEIFIFAEEKVDEMWNRLTLDICKNDLGESHNKILNFLELAKRDPAGFVNWKEKVSINLD